jgi:serine phosphatase RsbU (regulator of sigma subunit)
VFSKIKEMTVNALGPNLPRSVRIEKNINIFRLGFIIVLLIAAFFSEYLNQTTTIFTKKDMGFGVFFIILIPLLIFYHNFKFNRRSLKWAAYATITLDFAIIVMAVYPFLINEYLMHLDIASGLSFLFPLLLIFVNSFSVLRLNKRLIIYSSLIALLMNVLFFTFQGTFLYYGLITTIVIALMSLFNYWVTSYILGYYNINNELARAYDELQFANENINQKNEEISAQSDQIVQHLESLETIQKDHTDSLIYAQKIQKALINNESFFERFFEDYFIYSKPKSLVTGDFYWVTSKAEKIIIAVSDCTGHGVPGAFMTMLGYSYLNEIVNKEGITEPDHILNNLRDQIISTLHQDGKIYEQKDGMDMAVVQIDKKERKIKFSAANNSLCYIPVRMAPEDKKVYEFKGDRMPISFHYKMRHFSLLEFDIRKGDKFYLFTDGYIDQFGGPKGKKFKSVPFRRMLLKNHNLSMEEQKQVLERTMDDWLGDIYEQVDDITVLGFKI